MGMFIYHIKDIMLYNYVYSQILGVVLIMPNEEITKQINFRCRKSLYKRLRFQALNEDTTQADILNKALEEYLNKYENQTKLEIE